MLLTSCFTCFRTSDQLLEELFEVFGANVNIPDMMNGTGAKEKKSKKKKKRKHDDSDGESTSSKHKKAKKAKKVKKEKKSDGEDSKEHVKKAIKKEKKSAKDGEAPKKEVTERRKISIVIKNLKHRSEIVKPSTSKSSSSSKDKDREKEKEKEKRRKSKEREKQKEKDRKSREKKSSGDISDVSLSDEETYRKMLEYHTSSRWVDDRGNHVREYDRDKYRRERSRDDDRQ
jgi:ABC-type Na+ efflux pump permease subunit